MSSIHALLDQHAEIRELIENFVPEDYHNFLGTILCSYRNALLQQLVYNLRAENQRVSLTSTEVSCGCPSLAAVAGGGNPPPAPPPTVGDASYSGFASRDTGADLEESCTI